MCQNPCKNIITHVLYGNQWHIVLESHKPGKKIKQDALTTLVFVYVFLRGLCSQDEWHAFETWPNFFETYQGHLGVCVWKLSQFT